MNTLKKILPLLLLLSGSVILNSCSKTYLDINEDPNRATETTITPELIFTGAEVQVGARQASGNFLFLNHWMGYIAPNGDFAPNFKEQTYDISFSFGDPIWQNHYNVLFDLHQVQTKSMATGDSVLAAASIILSAKLFQELVDLFGNIPYSQAFQAPQNTQPAYDKGQDVYKSLLANLDLAVNYMKIATARKSFAAADVINGGDVAKWARFGNSLRLRLLLRQSEIPGFNPAPDLTKIANSGGILNDGESVGVNPGYVNDDKNAKQQPFYGNYGYTAKGIKSTTSDNANDYIVNILRNSGDARLSRFFQPVSGNTFVGDVYGDKQQNIPLGAASSYFGPGLIGEDLAGGLGATQSQWILPSFENMFMKAEAIARGWLTGGDQAAYQNAVTESFTWLKDPNAVSDAADVYTRDDAHSNWDSVAGKSTIEKARFIAYQKYIAMTAIDPLEAYSDQRRLHFLFDNSYISQNTARLSNSLPLRLLYPQSEYTTNSANALAQGNINQFTSKLFWQP